MKTKRHTLVGLLLLGLLSAGISAEESNAELPAIESLVREAYAHSPELRAAHARWASALERVPQARALPDPTVGYGYFIERMETRQVFRVEQMFPGWGVRSSRADVADAGARTAASALEVTAANLRLAVHEAVADWVLVGHSSRLVEENLGLIEQLEAVALQRYRTGETSQADVLRLQSQADVLRVDLESWKERRPAVQARLNAILGRAPDHPVPEIETLPISSEIPHPTPTAFFAAADNPDLKESQSAIHQAERARDLARKASRPNLMVGLEYMDNRSMAPDELMAMVSVSIPIWQGNYRAQRREAAADLRAAEADYAARFNRLQADARMALYERQDAARQVALFEDSLLPRARQTLSILEGDYRTGRTSFLDLLEAQRTVLDLDLALVRARSELFVRESRWERIAAPSPSLEISTSPTHPTSDE